MYFPQFIIEYWITSAQVKTQMVDENWKQTSSLLKG